MIYTVDSWFSWLGLSCQAFDEVNVFPGLARNRPTTNSSKQRLEDSLLAEIIHTKQNLRNVSISPPALTYPPRHPVLCEMLERHACMSRILKN